MTSIKPQTSKDKMVGVINGSQMVLLSLSMNHNNSITEILRVDKLIFNL